MVSNPWPAGHMQPGMALNSAQHKTVNLLNFFFSSVFISVCVFNVWPKTTLLLPMWPRDTKRLDIQVCLMPYKKIKKSFNFSIENLDVQYLALLCMEQADSHLFHNSSSILTYSNSFHWKRTLYPNSVLFSSHCTSTLLSPWPSTTSMLLYLVATLTPMSQWLL